jgi:hypothetical protein
LIAGLKKLNVTAGVPMAGLALGVQLLDNKSASGILYAVLSETRNAFPGELGLDSWPRDQAGFRKLYASLVPEFEAARLASSKRHEIAQYLANAMQQQLVWNSAGASCTLSECLAVVADPFPLEHIAGAGTGGWKPEFIYRETSWGDFAALGSELAKRNVITPAGASALSWIEQYGLAHGELKLVGRKIAVLGAAAEMAPTQAMLETGADVLWIDRAPPPAEWRQSAEFAGTLHYPPNNADLLTQPGEILATLLAFANGDPIDLCLYAYAPGQAREMRLTGAMNAIVNALPRELIASVTMLVSPTTPAELQADDRDAMQRRRDQRPVWEAMLEMLGLLGRGGGSIKKDQAAVVRTVVSIQGASYQAAQYFGKVLMAENWANQGLRVSANTAAITKTRSLDHPVFDAAFGGAAALGVETFTPQQSQCLNGLLSIHDWLHEDLPVPGRLRVHGGIHTLPYPLEAALRPAAAIGFARSPVLFIGFLKGLLSRQ